MAAMGLDPYLTIEVEARDERSVSITTGALD
jgi:hypothetical protein